MPPYARIRLITADGLTLPLRYRRFHFAASHGFMTFHMLRRRDVLFRIAITAPHSLTTRISPHTPPHSLRELLTIRRLTVPNAIPPRYHVAISIISFIAIYLIYFTNDIYDVALTFHCLRMMEMIY